jgi:hypothetical protein
MSNASNDRKTGEVMGLWRASGRPGASEGKYLVLHADGTVPAHPVMTLGARDPAVGAAICEYTAAIRGIRIDGRCYVGTLARAPWIVLRRDGTTPQWPFVVMHALDPAAPGALRAYAYQSFIHRAPERYRDDVLALADSFEAYRAERVARPGPRDWWEELVEADSPRFARQLSELRELADRFGAYRSRHGDGDPAAVPHRKDDPEIIRLMRLGQSA